MTIGELARIMADEAITAYEREAFGLALAEKALCPYAEALLDMRGLLGTLPAERLFTDRSRANRVLSKADMLLRSEKVGRCKCETCKTCQLKHWCNVALPHPGGWVRTGGCPATRIRMAVV